MKLPLLVALVGCAGCASTGVLVVLPGLAPFHTSEGIVGLPTVDGYRYLVPVDDGVVMIDAGFEPPTPAELAMVGGRRVHAILVTHGHLDHAGGLDAYPGVPVYVSRAELPYVRGERAWRAPLQQLLFAALGAPAVEGARVVEDGAVLTLGGRTFQAVALPGHTAGSTAWLMSGDIMFTGDALTCGGGAPSFPPRLFSDDEAAMVRSLRRLRDVPFAVMIDGHHGRCEGIWQRIPAFIRARRHE